MFLLSGIMLLQAFISKTACRHAFLTSLGYLFRIGIARPCAFFSVPTWGTPRMLSNMTEAGHIPTSRVER